MSAASYNLFLIKPVKWTCNVTKKRPKGRMWGNQNVGYTVIDSSSCRKFHAVNNGNSTLPPGIPSPRSTDKRPKSDSTRMS